MSCPSQEELMGHLIDDSAITAVNAHVADCAQCRASLKELSEITGRIGADPGELDEPDLAKDVMELIRLGQVPAPINKPRRLLYLAPVLAAAASVMLYVAVDTQPEFQARTGSAIKADRWISIDVYRSHTEQTGYQRVTTQIRPDDALAFAVTNRPPSEYQYGMIFAVDSSARVFWYYPAYLEAGSDPTSIEIRPGPKPQELGDAVRHDLSPGWLRVFGVLTREPLKVEQVESIVQGMLENASDVRKLGRLPIEASGQHTFLLRVDG